MLLAWLRIANSILLLELWLVPTHYHVVLLSKANTILLISHYSILILELINHIRLLSKSHSIHVIILLVGPMSLNVKVDLT